MSADSLAELLPILFPDDWDDERRIWTAEKPTLNDAYELFTDEIMSVSQDFQTGLTTVGIRWHDPDVAADWSNSLVDTLNREMRQRAIDEAGESIAYLKKELEATSVLGVQQAIHDLFVGLKRIGQSRNDMTGVGSRCCPIPDPVYRPIFMIVRYHFVTRVQRKTIRHDVHRKGGIFRKDEVA